MNWFKSLMLGFKSIKKQGNQVFLTRNILRAYNEIPLTNIIPDYNGGTLA